MADAQAAPAAGLSPSCCIGLPPSSGLASASASVREAGRDIRVNHTLIPGAGLDAGARVACAFVKRKGAVRHGPAA